jgi:dinuclear metal center YbgI/SA1388 family protein
MTLGELDGYFRKLLDFGSAQGIDPSLNGIQVGDPGRQVGRAAFAVDACMETFRRAAELPGGGADFLFVHHGIFWERPEPLSGPLLAQVAFLIERGISLYACHLPLDAHPLHGNAAVICRLLGMTELEPFGVYKGVPAGWAGTLPEEAGLDEIYARILPDGSRPLALRNFSRRGVRRVGVATGGAGRQAFEAIERGLDLFITGEDSHIAYHRLEEAGVAFIALGHYASEVWGPREMSELVSRDLGLPSSFIHLPTGT